MFCRNCGKEVAPQAVMCVSCGVQPHNGVNFCHQCGGATTAIAEFCTKCGVALARPAPPPTAKSKLAAGLLGIFLGGFGIHRFYLGYTGIGIVQLILTIVTCGIAALWGFIEGILILAGSMDRDAQGVALRD
jgi:TM2 domain-containing membrane protein YozV